MGEIKCNLGKFTNDNKQSGTVNIKGRDVIQSDLDELDMWAHTNLMGSRRPSTLG